MFDHVTASMDSYISSLYQVLDQIFTMVRILFGGKVFLHIISYKDYCDKTVIDQCHNTSEIKQWIKTNLTALGGGDKPEAAKTALNELYKHVTQILNSSKNSIVFVYTDAPPHHDHVGSNKDNINKERNYIQKNYQTPCDFAKHLKD